ncbi:transposable element Tcb2 transposase [Trichonephila clavipes]|nr:transposable element Tcb2 transposase [Trichonephila clavipes]
MGAEFLFMDENAHPHSANIVDECFQSDDVTRMDWPAYSPELNPIEHVWHTLGRRILARQIPPTCLPELRRALLDEWCNILQNQIDNLILSMPRRSLDRFNVHRCPTRRVFSGTWIELMTCLPWLDTLTTGLPQPRRGGRRSTAEKKMKQREQWPSRNPSPVVHKRRIGQSQHPNTRNYRED